MNSLTNPDTPTNIDSIGGVFFPILDHFIGADEPGLLTVQDVTAPSGDEPRYPLRFPPQVATTEARTWLSIICEADDCVEIRCLPPRQIVGEQIPRTFMAARTRYENKMFDRWVSPSTIDCVVNKLIQFNEANRITSWWGSWDKTINQWEDVIALADVRFNIYCSVNPRLPGTTKNNDVLLARCLFADLEKISVAEAVVRTKHAGLPKPSMIVVSGHGVHLYWRLNDPIYDLRLWSHLQKQLANALDGDESIHDPARIMRVPGFMNANGSPAKCYIVEVTDHRFDFKELTAPLPLAAAEHVDLRPIKTARGQTRGISTGTQSANSYALNRAQAYQRKIPPANEGERNSSTFGLAAAITEKFDLSLDDLLSITEEYNRRSEAPNDDSNNREATENAFDHIHAKDKERGTLLQHSAVEAYQEPKGDVRCLNEWREEMKQSRLESIKSRGSVFLDASTTGAGKSFADMSAMKIATKTLTLLPTHDACDELAFELNRHDLKAAAHPPLNGATCQRFGTDDDPGDARLAQKAGLNVGSVLCPDCYFHDKCDYQQQFSASKRKVHYFYSRRPDWPASSLGQDYVQDNPGDCIYSSFA